MKELEDFDMSAFDEPPKKAPPSRQKRLPFTFFEKSKEKSNFFFHSYTCVGQCRWFKSIRWNVGRIRQWSGRWNTGLCHHHTQHTASAPRGRHVAAGWWTGRQRRSSWQTHWKRCVGCGVYVWGGSDSRGGVCGRWRVCLLLFIVVVCRRKKLLDCCKKFNVWKLKRKLNDCD